MFILFTGVFSMVAYTLNFDRKVMDLSAENVEAFAGIIDVDISPDASGYCRCKITDVMPGI